MEELPWEDNLLERKLESDLKDLLKTLVAFSNSVRPGHIATILIGERDDGTIQGVTNPDNIQKKVRRECERIYPPIQHRTKVYLKEEKPCIRVEVEYDGDTPHFGGPAWIRKGSETIKASEPMFQKLIELRSSIVFELEKWVGNEVSVEGNIASIPRPIKGTAVKYPTVLSHRWDSDVTATLLSVKNFWITLKRTDTGNEISEPLKNLTLSFDDNKERLKIIVDF